VQASSQAEQWLADVFRSTQAPLHAVIPAGQALVHLPCAQTAPAEQTEPQAPQ
jgi:hypothetical protein